MIYKMASQSKSKKKNIPKSVNEMSKEQLHEILKKKKECNAKALQTVEKLCELEVDEKWFLDNLQFINQTHFDDVTVERAILKMCGYPLCSKALEKIPAQQFHISTKYNKVFDITERKNFCSSSCYKASSFVKNQLFTSPLWFRDQEVIPKYSVLKSCKSSSGEEVVFDADKIKESEETNKSEFDVKELEENYSKLTVSESPKVNMNETAEESKENQNSCSLSSNVVNENELTEKKSENVKVKTKVNESNEVRESCAKVKLKTQSVDTVSKVESCVFEWFSLDSLFYLFKKEKIKKMFSNETTNLLEALNSKLKMSSYSDKIDRIIQLYGLLEGTTFSGGSKMNLKPLPDYSSLKEEGKMLEIKVKAFYQGQLEVKPTAEKEEKVEKEETEGEPIYLPLVDAHSQLALRRKILLDKLNKVLPDLIRIFGTEFTLKMSEVRNLVSTFSLAAHNITFKPNEWYLVGIILIKLLSLKDVHLKSILQLESSQKQISLILLNYDLKGDYLENLIQRLTNSGNILQKLEEINK